MSRPRAERAHAPRIPKSEHVPRIVALREKGYTVEQTAKAMHLSTGYIYNVMRSFKKDGTAEVHVVPQPRQTRDLAPEVKKCMSYTSLGFRRFFDRYSGRKLSPVHKRWVADALSSDRVLINVPQRHAKLLADDTPVFTTEGWKRHGDLVEGDRVFSPNGEAVEVLTVLPKSVADYRITFSDGGSIECSGEHEWPVRDKAPFLTDIGKRRGVRRSRERTMTTLEMLAEGTQHENGKRNSFLVGNPPPLEMSERELPLDPYFLGVWLGDGKATGASICGAPDDLAEILIHLKEREFPEPSWSTVHKDTGVIYCGWRNVQVVLKQIGVFGNKHIPAEYLTSSIEQRRNLLHGLVDTDGSIDRDTGRVRVVTVSPELADDIATLVRSLGYRANIYVQAPNLKSRFNSRLSTHVVTWSPPDGLPQAKLFRKIHPVPRPERRDRGIVSIEPIDPKPGNCITVMGGSYLAGERMVPTFNSTVFTVWFTLWLVCMDRNIQIILISKTDKLALKFSNEIAHHLEDNALLVKDFGRFRPDEEGWPWRPNAGELMVMGRDRSTKSGDLTLQVRGSGQQILGMEANWIIVDDPVDPTTMRSPTEREKIEDWFHGEVMSRLESETGSDSLAGHAVVVGQRVHVQDLYGQLAREVDPDTGEAYWKHIVYPAVLNWETHKVLWPEQWPWAKLMKRYKDMGKHRFETMMQQNPMGAGQRLAEREWLYGGVEDGPPGCIDYTRVVGEPGKFDSAVKRVRVASLDPSPTRYAGFIIADIEYGSGIFATEILELRREKMQVRDMLDHLRRAIDVYQIDYFIFERSAAQRWLLQAPEFDEFKRKTKVIAHDTGRNKGDPVLGVGSLSMDFEFGRIRFPYGDAESKAMTELLFNEALNWPEGETDDLLMSLWFIKFNFARLVPRHPDLPSGQQPRSTVPPRLSKGWGYLQPKEQKWPISA